MRKALLALVVAAVAALIYVFALRPQGVGPTTKDSRSESPEDPAIVTAVQGSLRDKPSATRIREQLAAGADANSVDASGRPALTLAIRNNDAPAAEALLAKGADANKRDKENWTPLMTAAFQAARDPKFLPMVKLLLAHAADPNASKDGTTALHVAVNNIDEHAKEAPVITMLLGGGAKPDGVPAETPTSFTMSPVQLAAWNGKTAAALALAKGGASLGVPPKGGKSAAQTARDHGHADLAAALDKFSKTKPR
jgi:ankyrin repeat protein